MLLVILMVEKFVKHFTKKNCKKTNQKILEQKKEKARNYTSNEKVITIYLIAGLIKKILLYKYELFSTK